jgi:hypothetical protein
MSHNYTYLELVNAVLVRLREDTVLTVAGTDDVVVELVKGFVNDAKRTCEDAYTWSALAFENEFVTSTDTDRVVLTDTHKSAIIEDILDNNGNQLPAVNKTHIRKKALQGGNPNTPLYYAVVGTEASTGDLELQLWPKPKEAATYHVYGYQRTHPFTSDNDILTIPAGLAVIYLAQAMAARERGEAGAQPPQELIMLAQRYLSDAIAMDSTNTEMDNIWTSV